MSPAANIRASALLITMWALILLSASVLSWAAWIQADLTLTGEASRALEAKAMALSGVTMALNIAVTKDSPQLERQFNSQVGYRVRMIGEGGKLNINLLLEGENPRKLLILNRWLEQKGLGFQERDRLVDCLLDYVDGDNLKRLNGIEDFEDYHPANDQLKDLDEILDIPNTEPLTSQPGWRDDLTLYSDGKIDLSSASADILRLLGLGDAVIQRFIKYRSGLDGVDGNQDDVELSKFAKVVEQILGLGPGPNKDLSGMVTMKSDVMRIISVGQSSKVLRQVEVVAQKTGATPQIKYWKE